MRLDRPVRRGGGALRPKPAPRPVPTCPTSTHHLSSTPPSPLLLPPYIHNNTPTAPSTPTASLLSRHLRVIHPPCSASQPHVPWLLLPGGRPECHRARALDHARAGSPLHPAAVRRFHAERRAPSAERVLHRTHPFILRLCLASMPSAEHLAGAAPYLPSRAMWCAMCVCTSHVAHEAVRSARWSF